MNRHLRTALTLALLLGAQPTQAVPPGPLLTLLPASIQPPYPSFLTLLAAQDTLVVIVNNGSGVSTMTPDEVTNIFMGRQKRLTSGLVVLPVESVGDAEVRGRFYMALLNLPLPQVRAYWARMYFSAAAQPPRQVQTAEDVIQVVQANKGAVGFVEKARVDHRVKAVLVLRE